MCYFDVISRVKTTILERKIASIFLNIKFRHRILLVNANFLIVIVLPQF